jgi:hypothetical protein
MDNNGTYERNRKSEVELLWTQFEDLIEHGKNKDANTKLELLQRIYQFLAETLPKSNQEKKVLGLKSSSLQTMRDSMLPIAVKGGTNSVDAEAPD